MKKTPYLLGLAIAFALGSLVPNLPLVVLAQSGTTDYIHACVKNNNGSIRIEAAGVSCKANESALDWTKNAGAGSNLPFICPGCVITNNAIALLQGKDLSNAYLAHVSFVSLDLQGTNFTNAVLEEADLTGASLASANLTDAQMLLATLVYSDLTGANMTRADMRVANLAGADATSAIFVDADLSDIAASGTNFTNANFTGANLTSARLDGANLTGAILTNVTWSNTTCPDSTFSDDNGGTCIGHLTP